MDLRSKLLITFDAEQREILTAIRSCIYGLELKETTEVDPKIIEEAFRMAHTLKGASRIVDLLQVTRIAHSLESLFYNLQNKTLKLDSDLISLMGSALNAIEDLVAASKNGEPNAQAPPKLVQDLEERLRRSAAAESHTPHSKPPTQSVAKLNTKVEASLPHPDTIRSNGILYEDTLRIQASQLDQILNTATVLGQCQPKLEQSTRALTLIISRLNRISKQVQSIKGLCRASDNKIDQVFHLLESDLKGLDKQASQLMHHARQNQREFKHLSQALHRDLQQLRIIPADSVLGGFHKMVRDLAQELGREVELQTSGLEMGVDRLVLQSLKDPVMHLLRNSIAHGIEDREKRALLGKPKVGKIALILEPMQNRIVIKIKDDGRGLQHDAICSKALGMGLINQETVKNVDTKTAQQWIFLPGFSTADHLSNLAGRGMGLSVVREGINRLKGDISVHSDANFGTEFVISTPNSVTAHPILKLMCNQNYYGLLCYGVQRLQRVRPKDIGQLEGKPAIEIRGDLIPIISLSDLIGIQNNQVGTVNQWISVALLKIKNSKLAIAVDEFLNEEELMVSYLPSHGLTQLPAIFGTSLNEDGNVILILDPAKLIELYQSLKAPSLLQIASPRPKKQLNKILVVDDSFTTRTLEKGILETSGYQVTLAVNGSDALNCLRQDTFDLVVTDLEMPTMDGLRLLQSIKNIPKFQHLPVILVTSCDQEVKKEEAIKLGAVAFIVKSRFDQATLLETIRSVIEKPTEGNK